VLRRIFSSASSSSTSTTWSRGRGAPGLECAADGKHVLCP
jgi:hypothetical protein